MRRSCGCTPWLTHQIRPASQSEDELVDDLLPSRWSRSHVVMDLDEAKSTKGSRACLFEAPLLRAGAAGGDKAFDERCAGKILGPFDGPGRPAHAPVRLVHEGSFLRFS